MNPNQYGRFRGRYVHIFLYNVHREEVNNCSALGKRSATEVEIEKTGDIDDSTSVCTIEEGTAPKQPKL